MTAPRQAEGTGAAPAPSPACLYLTCNREHETVIVTWDEEFAQAWIAHTWARRREVPA